MKIKIFTTLLLLGIANAAPFIDDNGEHLVVTKEFFPFTLVKYKSSHDIVNIVVPLNSFNFDVDNMKESSDSSSDSEEVPEVTVFFAEADIENGKPSYKGLYALKEGHAKLILENGRDAAASADESNTVYLAASDGVYTYKKNSQMPEKFGSITDSIIGIAKESEGDVLYVLTEEHVVYKVSDNGNSKVKLEGIVDAQQIILDTEDNLFFSTSEKKVYAYTSNGVKFIEGLPENPSKLVLIKPPIIVDSGFPVLVNNTVYLVYVNGTSEYSGMEFKPDAVPSGFGPEGTVIQYYALNKKIYEYNVFHLVNSSKMEPLKHYLGDKADDIQKLANQKQGSKKSKH